MSDSSETRWFKIMVFISTGFIAGVSLANIVYFNRIRTQSCSAVTSGEATTMLWLNVIIFILSVIVFMWALWRLLFDRSLRDKVEGEVTGFLYSDKGPITYNSTTTVTTPGPVGVPMQNQPTLVVAPQGGAVQRPFTAISGQGGAGGYVANAAARA